MLLHARQMDLRRLITSVGPHRDDVRVLLNGQDARAYGSQGQVRTCALSLKLSELEIMRRESGESPVLMLDDVMSELDPGRRRLLIGMLEDVQTFVTCTDPTDLAGARHPGRVFRVKNATLTEENAGKRPAKPCFSPCWFSFSRALRRIARKRLRFTTTSP